MLTDDERELLQVPSHDLESLQGIDDAVSRASSRSSLSGFDVRRATQKLYGKDVNQRNSTQPWDTGLVLGF